MNSLSNQPKYTQELVLELAARLNYKTSDPLQLAQVLQDLWDLACQQAHLLHTEPEKIITLKIHANEADSHRALLSLPKLK